jgi:hypothetical protein
VSCWVNTDIPPFSSTISDFAFSSSTIKCCTRAPMIPPSLSWLLHHFKMQFQHSWWHLCIKLCRMCFLFLLCMGMSIVQQFTPIFRLNWHVETLRHKSWIPLSITHSCKCCLKTGWRSTVLLLWRLDASWCNFLSIGNREIWLYPGLLQWR